MFWLGMLCLICVVVIIILSLKIFIMRRSADEIATEFTKRLTEDTNTLISISSHDSSICNLADQINQQLRHLRKQRQRYLMGDHELKDAVMNISHDLRTPLTAICGYLDLLEEEDISKKSKYYLEIIKNRVNVLCELTEELFRYSTIVTTFQNEDFEKVSLNSVLEETLSAYYGALSSRQMIPKISIPEERIYCYVNKKALVRILGNIMSNAIKYSDGDLVITLLNSGEMIFTNHASQLDEVHVGKLFNRFYTVESATQSTGLGLAIAKLLTEQMQGQINATYQQGCFSIHLKFKTNLS